LELDLRSDRASAVVDGRRAGLLVQRDVAALQPERRRHGVRHDVGAVLALLACFVSKGQLLCHAYLPLFGDETEDVFLTENEKLLVVELEFGPGVLLEQNAITLFEIHRNALAGVGVAVAGSDSKDAALLGLLLGGVRQDDPALRDFLTLEGLDHYAGAERLELRLRLGIGL